MRTPIIREKLTPRVDWVRKAEESGFAFHHVDGQIYWDESAAYRFTLQQIEEDLESAGQDIHAMCLELVDKAVRDEEILLKLKIPSFLWDMIKISWHTKDASLYGRFDFAYDGTGPAKLYEYNADTPTALYEAAYFQWLWLEDMAGILPPGADQFNSIQEGLISVFESLAHDIPLHLACVQGSAEDFNTVEYLANCASEAGLESFLMYIEDIGLTASGRFVDLNDKPIRRLFKLYPWEMMGNDEYGRHLPSCGTAFIEPPWKMILSNKGILPLLWSANKGHPNLLPAFFENDSAASCLAEYVRKPLFSREGANISVFRNGHEVCRTDGQYGAEGAILQQYHEGLCFDGNYPVCGVWIVGDECRGLGIREDKGFITANASRFVPHYITI